MERIPVIIDTDPGHDDAVALMMAMSGGTLGILGITLVAGNNTMENAAKNALKLLGHFGWETKVYPGAERPMVQDLEVSRDAHGKKGMDGTTLEKSTRRVEEQGAVSFMEETLLGAKERVTLIALGPLTNIGTLLLCAPELRDRIRSICLMGGATIGGSRTPAAESNIWQDPEAAHVVFTSGVPVTMCGLDVTLRSGLKAADIERVGRVDTKAGRLASELLGFYRKAGKDREDTGIVLHDAVAVAKVMKPGLFRSEMCHVAIDLDGKYTRGCTVTDRLGVTGKKGNVEVVMEVDRQGFVDFLVQALEDLDDGRRDEG